MPQRKLGIELSHFPLEVYLLDIAFISISTDKILICVYPYPIAWLNRENPYLSKNVGSHSLQGFIPYI